MWMNGFGKGRCMYLYVGGLGAIFEWCFDVSLT